MVNMMVDNRTRRVSLLAAALEDLTTPLVGTYDALHESDSAEVLESLLNNLPDPLVVKDREHRYILVNDAMCSLLGRGRDAILGRTDADFVPEEQARAYFAGDDQVFASGQETDLEEELTTADGSMRLLRTRKRRVEPGPEGSEPFLIVSMMDITESRRDEIVMRESEERFRMMADGAPVMIWMSDASGMTTFANKLWLTLTGQTYEEAIGYDWLKSIHPDDKQRVALNFTTASARHQPFQVEYRLRRADGSWAWVFDIGQPRIVPDKTFQGFVGCVLDITERKRAEERLRWAAHHDELTGLPNRRLFQGQIEKAFVEASHGQRRVGLLAMDVDNFKQINDQFGHASGDAFLKVFAERLHRFVGSRGLTARLGGDEFAVLLPDVGGKEDISSFARAVLDHMHEPLLLDGNTLDCSASIGGAVTYLGLDEGPDELIKQADLALYASKAAGRSVYTIFHASIREERQKVASALRVAGQAVACDWIVPYFQPKVDIGAGKLNGFEALLRWEDPHAGIQLPSSIAPAFENTDLGIAIGDRMRFCVIKHLRHWMDAGIKSGRIAVNASSAEFRRDDYAERVLGDLRCADLPTSCLEVEVTEGVFIGFGSEFVARALRKLSDAGVTIALDDFGTGYASLSNLKQFPVHVIKIDRSFVGGIEGTASDAAIVKAVLGLGRDLGVQIVAEGVETAAQAAFLRRERCSTAQGFYFGRPMAAVEVAPFIASWHDGKTV